MEINNHDKLYLLSSFDRISITFHTGSGGLGPFRSLCAVAGCARVPRVGPLLTVVWKFGVDGVVGV